MKTANRLLYLDWMRGLAAAVMLQGHVFHSFLRDDLRGDGPYKFSQFLGGMPPAAFLFLTGITLSFLMDSTERKGMTPGGRWIEALKRSRYLFIIAFAFRLQLWLFAWLSGPNHPMTEMLKVDILNCMGFSIAVVSVMALFSTMERIKLSAGLGCAIALLAPLVTQAGAGWPWLAKAYLVPSYDYFSFFPWAAFIAFGLSFGSILRVVKPEQLTHTMQWAALAGIAIAFGAGAVATTGPAVYAKAEFWLDSPSLIFIKLGALLIVTTFAYVWMMQPAAAERWSWVRQLGTTSLIVYWVHIELVYGNWLGWMKNNLGVGQTLVAAAAIIAAMVAVSFGTTSWSRWRRAVLDWFRTPEAARVSGD